MSREIRLTLEDDQFEQLNQLKERHGYTWKGLLIEGSMELDKQTETINDRDRLKEMVETLREEYRDREHHHTIRISSVTGDRSGNEHLGIRVMMRNPDQFELTGELEAIEGKLYDSGYNTAWAYESQHPDDEDVIPKGDYTGKVSALLLERGVPVVPNAHPFREDRTHQNVHR